MTYLSKLFAKTICIICLLIFAGQVYCQDLKIEPVGQAYHSKITGLKKLNSVNEIAPFYSSFLIYNTGYYEKAKISNQDHAFSKVKFGAEWEGKKAEVYAVSTSRYSDDLPPEFNVINEDATTIENTDNHTTFNHRLNSDHEKACISIDTNHNIIFSHKNIIALSAKPENGTHLYLFFNRKVEDPSPEFVPVDNFTSFTKTVLQAHYINSSEIEESTTSSFDNTHSKNFRAGGFNNYISYEFDKADVGRSEYRLFVGLDNDGVFESEEYELLAIQTMNDNETEIEICKGDGENESRFQEVESLLDNDLTIGSEIVTTYQFLTLSVEPPNDPNGIIPTKACNCGNIRDTEVDALKKYYYSFQFCNQSPEYAGNEGTIAKEARITFTDLSNRLDCITPLPETKKRLSDQQPLTWELEVNLEDLSASGDYSRCCDTIYFYATELSTQAPSKYPIISACVTFNNLQVDPVCDTLACMPNSSHANPCNLKFFPCESLFSFDCDNKRYKCFKLPTAPIYAVAIGVIGLLVYRRSRKS